jgi:hypothetical protein
MDRKEIEELARQADRQVAVDRARDATLRAASAGRGSGPGSEERVAAPRSGQIERQGDPGPIEGASGAA